MNKFIYFVQKEVNVIQYGITTALHGSDCKEKLNKWFPDALTIDFFGYTGMERDSQDIRLVELP